MSDPAEPLSAALRAYAEDHPTFLDPEEDGCDTATALRAALARQSAPATEDEVAALAAQRLILREALGNAALDCTERRDPDAIREDIERAIVKANEVRVHVERTAPPMTIPPGMGGTYRINGQELRLEAGDPVPATDALPVGAHVASALMASNIPCDSGEDVDRFLAELAKRGYGIARQLAEPQS